MPTKMDPTIWYPVLSVLTLLSLAAQYTISFLVYEAPYEDLYDRSHRHQLNKYQTSVSPYRWAHFIWPGVYGWQLAWVVYALILICRKSKERGPRYNDPVYLPALLFIFTIVQCGCHVAWRILFDRNHMIASFVLLVVYSLLLYASLMISYFTMARASYILYSQKRSYDIWFVRVLLQNSLGLHVGWCSFEMLLAMGQVMRYEGDPDVGSETTGTVILSVLLGWILIYAFVDFCVYERQSRYNFMFYAAMAYATAAVVSRHFDGDEHDRNSILMMIALGVSGCFCFLKLLIALCKCRNEYPLPVVKEDSNDNDGQIINDQELYQPTIIPVAVYQYHEMGDNSHGRPLY